MALKLLVKPAEDKVCEAAVVRNSWSPDMKPVEICTLTDTKLLLSESVTVPCGDSKAVPTEPAYKACALALLDRLTTGLSLTDTTVNS